MSVSPSAAAYAVFLSTKKFVSLDGLRCLSILAVVWHHSTDIGKGYLGVEIFFAISGFLITTLLLRERQAYGDISLPKFYARRSLRIFPLYYAVLLLYVVLVLATQRQSEAGQGFFHNLPFFLTYTSNWFVPLNGRTIFYLSWSLATEEQFYLVVPSIEKYLRRFAVPLLIFAVVLQIASYSIPLGVVIQKISLPLCFGVLAAHALNSEKGFRYIAVLTHAKAWAPVWTAAVLFLAWIDAHPLPLGVAMTGLVVSSVIRPDHGMAWFLNWEPFQAVGRVSYGMYLLHQLCLGVLRKFLHVPPPAFFLCGTAATFLAASASYRWFESIFLNMKERYTPGAGKSQAASGPAYLHQT